MGSHHHPDDPDDDFDGASDTGRDGGDHFGLFDDAPGAHDDDRPTGEMDLDALREVLAGRRHHEEPERSPRRAARAEAPAPRRRRKGRRALTAIIALLVVGLIAAGVVFGIMWWRQSNTAPEDWAGTGERTVVVRVYSGDGLYDVGQTLVKAGVVASVKSFVAVAGDDGRLSGLQPGYYLVHEHSSSQSIVNDLANPDSRLGQVRIFPGQTLADITKVDTDGKTGIKEGILSAIASACTPTNGDDACFTVDQLREVARTAKLTDLGVVGWALDDASKAPDQDRRLEGLILAGDYDVAPGSTAFEALRDVVSSSTARWNTSGIVAAAEAQQTTPYRLAVIASLAQAEGRGDDMRKVARVIDNRLEDGMPLEFDSTVNYGLDRSSISTTNAERTDASNLYSTYAHKGLTPTPIGAPEPQALDAALDPVPGPWLYFVAIDLDGNTCFSETYDQHLKCVDEARANGVFG